MIMGPALACYFRRSWYLGKNRLPRKGAVVVISNHAASFLDAMLMGVMLKRPIHFYVRGDIYKKKWVRTVFSWLHMMPLYSADLAKEQLHRNADSFAQGEEILRKGGLLLIFPEGLSRMERNMMPFKKGVSRIILQALASDPKLTVNVVPIGIHYSRHEVLSDVQLTTGRVVEVADQYRQLYTEHAPKGVNELTHELERAMREVVLYVAQDERSPIIETQLEMFDNERHGPFSYEHFREQKKLCDDVSSLSEEEAAVLAAKQREYFDLLNKHNLNDEVVAGRKRVLLPAILLLLGLPLFLLSFINYPPFAFGKWMADTKVTREDFYTSVITAVSAFSYVVWLALMLLLSRLLESNLLLMLFGISPLLGWYAVRYWQHYKNFMYRRNLKRIPLKVADELTCMRAEIRSL